MTLPVVDSTLLINRENWVCVKENTNDTVYQTHWENDAAVIVKEYRLSSLSSRLSFSRKFKTLAKFYGNAQSNLPVAKLLTVGVSAQHCTGLCFFEALPGIDFRKIDWIHVSETEAEAMGAEVGELLKNLHSQNWIHGDFKFGNLLYNSLAVAATPKIYLLDIENITQPRFARTRKRARDVARFVLNGLELQAPNTLLAAFWHRYTQPLSDGDIASIKRYVLVWLRKLAARHANQYDRHVDLSSLPIQ